MTYPAPDELPYDSWFDKDYKYVPYAEYIEDTLDDRPLAINDRFDLYGSSDAEYAYSMHQAMYDLSTKSGKSWLGGSENVFS